MTLYEYRINLGWTVNRLAKEAGISRPAAAAAEEGRPIKPETAKALADALGSAMGKEIRVTDIQGLKVT